MGGARFPRAQRDRGAAAVEFALVVPLLLVLMFGIVDYGLWFGDSLNARQGVDEAARRAVVKDFGTCAGTNEAQKTACLVENHIGALAGSVYVKVAVSGPGSKVDDWDKGAQLLVCAMVREEGLTGLTPMPDDGILTAKVVKRIEIKGGSTVPSYAETPPSGATWGFCT